MARRYKKVGYNRATVPIKKEKYINALMKWLLVQRDKAPSEIKRYQYDRDWMFCMLGINFAFRSEDLLALRVVDLKNGYVSITENKTGKPQNFRMNKNLYKDFKEYVDRNNLSDFDYLFTGQKGNEVYPITRQQMDRRLKKAAKAINLPQRFSCHSMRKTFGYQYVLKGGKIETLSKMYNHDSVTTTEIYICWGKDDAENDRYTNYLGGVHRKGGNKK